MANIAKNYEAVKQKIAAAAQRAGRKPQDVLLVAVTKFASIESVNEAISLGILNLGENKIQAALSKVSLLENSPIIWHMIGHLQTNKVKPAVRYFQLIHSVDSLKLAEALDKEAAKQGKLIEILLEVNLSGEEAKYGLPPEEVTRTLQKISSLKNIKVNGLMTMAPYYEDPELARPLFRGLRELKERAETAAGLPLKYLSMGMTNDYEIAIEEGANIVRIGTALFKD